MNKQELDRFEPALETFLAEFSECAIAPTRRLIAAYIRGQIGPLPRKSVMPMARDQGIPPRTLQELLSLHRWDEPLMRRILRDRIDRLYGGAGLLTVSRETACLKKGDKPPGVALQPSPATGRPANCCVVLHLAAGRGPLRAVIESELYLPDRWISDRARSAAAGIPEDVGYRNRSRIVRDLVERAVEADVELGTLLLGSGVGSDVALLHDLASLDVRWVAAASGSVRGWKGPLRPGAPSEKAQSLEALAGGLALSWRVNLAEGSVPRGAETIPVGSFAFHPEINGVPGPQFQALTLRRPWSGEANFLLTNAPVPPSPESLVRAAFLREPLETKVGEDLAEIGFDHFEVRTYRSLQRHLTLSSLSLLFLAEVRERRRVGDTARAAVGGTF